MQWSKGRNAGFSAAETEKLYLPVDEDGVNVEDQLADETSLLHMVQKLIALRKSSPALCADGEIEFVNRRHNGYPLVYRRWKNQEEYLICINPLDCPDHYPVGDDWESVMANHKADLSDGVLNLDAFGFVILRKK